MVRFIVNKIREAYNDYNCIFCYIIGNLGSGKTSFALHVSKELLGSWDRVLDHLYFSLDDFLMCIRDLVLRGERVKVIILDDAGSSIPATMWREKEAREISALINLARTYVSSILFTTPDFYDILKRVRVKINYLIETRKIEERRSLARVYQYKYSTGWDKYYRKLVKEIQYPRYYPDDVFRRYNKMRREFIRKLVERLLPQLKESTISLCTVICPNCGEKGTLALMLRNPTTIPYIKVYHHRENRVCYLGKLKENKELFIKLIKESS